MVVEEVAMMAGIVGMMMIGVLLLHCILISPIRHERQQSLNMLKIMPHWVIERSPELKKMIYNKPHP